MKPPCMEHGCHERNHARGLCLNHYAARKRAGTLPERRTAQERFWAKVDATGDCWIWTAGLDTSGYGCFFLVDRMRLAHRLAWEWTVGQVPVGLDLDHLCRNRRCVNPAHLDAVTHAENVRRARLAVNP